MAVESRFESDFVIKDVENASSQYDKAASIKQVPFALAVKGVVHRNRAKPYLISQSDDPEKVVT
jgi:hypothetical protein